jgi:uncharacterized protein (TIGR00369 family)
VSEAVPLDRLVEAVPYHRFLGLRAGPDGTVVLPGEHRHVADDGRAVLHGGVLAALVEAAGLLHLQASGAPRPAPIDVTTDYLRAAVVADAHAAVTEVRRGRRVAHLRIEVWQSDRSHPVAAAHGTWLLEAGPPGGESSPDA